MATRASSDRAGGPLSIRWAVPLALAPSALFVALLAVNAPQSMVVVVVLAVSAVICGTLLRRGAAVLVAVYLLGVIIPLLSLLLVYHGLLSLFDQHPSQTGPAR